MQKNARFSLLEMEKNEEVTISYKDEEAICIILTSKEDAETSVTV